MEEPEGSKASQVIGDTIGDNSPVPRLAACGEASPPSTLLLGDCLEQLPSLPAGCAHMVLTDLPYSVLAKSSEGGSWDKEIPLAPLWEQFLRVAKHNAAIVLFAQGMFTARLMMSQPSLYRYTLIWEKNNPSGFLNAYKMPMRCHEDILVFYRSLPTYNPQMVKCEPHKRNHSRGDLSLRHVNRCYGVYRNTPTIVSDEKFPRSILRFPKPHRKSHFHPTEKPVDLCRWLIRTYTNPGEIVLDATMGSGTTGVACALEGRGFIGIEKEPKYFEIAQRRIAEAGGAAVREGAAPSAPYRAGAAPSAPPPASPKSSTPKTPALIQGDFFA